MSFIQNFDSLAISAQRRVVLTLVDEALASIQPKAILEKNINLTDNILSIKDHSYDLKNYERVFLLGFGKGSAGISKYIETLLGDKLTGGFVIDTVEEKFEKIKFTLGTHPLPSEENISFTANALNQLSDLSEKDFVIVVICGGGSVLFEAPHTVTLETLTQIVKALLKSGANISEMNIIRKHLSKVKGGGLAKILFPANITSLIFSDVPGNDLSVIASGPTVPDITTMENVESVLQKYEIKKLVNLPPDAFGTTIAEEKYFAKVTNILMVSNLTALHAMKEKAKEIGIPTRIYTDKLQGDARTLGRTLLEATGKGEILLAGGESTIKITGNGHGGRNQALILSALPFLDDETVLASFDSDGWDFHEFAGAIANRQTNEKMSALGIDPKSFLDNDDSSAFFEKTGDGILTGQLLSNVSDLYIVYKT